MTTDVTTDVTTLADLTTDAWQCIARTAAGRWTKENGKWSWLIGPDDRRALDAARDAGRIVTVQNNNGELLARLVPRGTEPRFRSDLA